MGKDLEVAHLSPAELVIKTFGSVHKTAKAVGRTPACISKWRRRLDGALPPAIQKKVLALSEAQDLGLTPRELIMGRG